MSSAPSSTLRLIAALERGGFLGQAGTRPPVELPDRRATRVHPPAPSALDLLQLAQDHDANVAAYVARHGHPVPPRTDDRTALHLEASTIAAADPAAAEELAALDLADSLRAALLAGDGHQAVEAISCPQCLCWSLLAIRSPRGGGWAAACRNTRCATPQGPRTWSLRAIAAHHLRDSRVA